MTKCTWVFYWWDMIKSTVNVDRGVKGTSVLSLAMNKTEATQPTSVLPVAQKARPRVSSVLVFHQNTRTRERKHTWLLEKPKESVQLSVAELKSNWEVFPSLDSSFSSWFKSHFVIACFQVITDVNHFHGEDKVWSIFDCHYEGGVSVVTPASILFVFLSAAAREYSVGHNRRSSRLSIVFKPTLSQSFLHCEAPLHNFLLMCTLWRNLLHTAPHKKHLHNISSISRKGFFFVSWPWSKFWFRLSTDRRFWAAEPRSVQTPLSGPL